VECILSARSVISPTALCLTRLPEELSRPARPETLWFTGWAVGRDCGRSRRPEHDDDLHRQGRRSYDPENGQATIIWTSNPRKTYAVESSTDLISWIELDDGIAGKEEQTSFGDEPAAGTVEIYYRVRQVQ
jgi:hypothetical protein